MNEISQRTREIDDEIEALNQEIERMREMRDEKIRMVMISSRCEALKGLTDQEVRTRLNNERIFIDEQEYRYAVRGDTYLDISTLLTLSKTDPLAKELFEQYKSGQNNLIVLCSDPLRKLVMRKIKSEEEYEGYLNGDLPILESNGMEFYLRS